MLPAGESCTVRAVQKRKIRFDADGQCQETRTAPIGSFHTAAGDSALSYPTPEMRFQRRKNSISGSPEARARYLLLSAKCLGAGREFRDILQVCSCRVSSNKLNLGAWPHLPPDLPAGCKSLVSLAAPPAAPARVEGQSVHAHYHRVAGVDLQSNRPERPQHVSYV